MPPREPVYRAGTNPGGTPSYSGAGPDAFGAAIGRGLTDLGAAMEREKLVKTQLETRRKRDTEAADAGVKLAEVTGDIDVFSQQRRQQAEPGGAGHSEAVLAELDKQEEAALGAITDEQVRNAYRERYAELRARVLAREDGWERGARIEHMVEGIDRTGTLYANQQAAMPSADGTGLEAALNAVEVQVGQLDLSDDAKAKIVREQQRKITVAWANAMQVTDHALLLAALDKGFLNPFLEPSDIAVLRDGALVEQRREEAAARAVAAEQEATAREAVSLFIKRIEAGDQPSEAEFDETAALAKQYGLEGQVFDVEVRRSEVRVNRETRDWTPQQFDAAINGLRAKGDKRSTAENIQLAQLERIRDGRVSEFVSDPQAYAARIGNPAPAVNWEAPSADQVQARVTWARGYAAANGLVNAPYLSTEEMRPLRERADQGPAGQLEVSQQLRARFGAGVGAEIARQLDPNDKTMQLMVGLSSSAATWYGEGIEARKRNPALFDREAALDVFDDVAEAIPQDLRTPVFDAAANIQAALQDRGGVDKFNEDSFRTSLDFAMGALGRKPNLSGGIGDWNGRKLWLPPGVSQGDFETRVQRATGPQIVAAAVDARGSPNGQAPHYMGADGKVGRSLKPSEWKELQFETVSPGVYRVLGPIGGVLVDARGRPWMIDVRRLP